MSKCPKCGYDDHGTGDSAHYCPDGRAAPQVASTQDGPLIDEGTMAAQPAVGPSPHQKDMSLLIARLSYALKKAAPEHELPANATAYLQKHDLIGSPLRDADEPAVAPSIDTLEFREILEDFAHSETMTGEQVIAYIDAWASRRAASPAPTDAQFENVCTAVAEALGDALDCTRTWSAWGHGTMREGDFVSVAGDNERVAEIARAAIAADRLARSKGGG